MSGGGKGGQTIGFHYLFSILFGIGRGPIDELRAIKVGDKVAWDGHACEPGLNSINQPDLFGGEKKEGGIQGLFYLNQGAADQVLPGPLSGSVYGLAGKNPGGAAGGGGVGGAAALLFSGGPYNGTRTLPGVKEKIISESGGEMGELRGRVTLWFDGLVASMNPYIKEWTFRVRRARKGWHNDDPWYPEKAIIFLNEGRIFAMNPAHMIYECCTNPSWARGVPTSLIDHDSFTLVANTLCAENFGLCMVWYRKEDIDQFVQTILDHVGGVLYTDRETGKITLKMIRDDYDVDDLPVFGFGSGLLDIQEDDSGSSDTAFNEVIVTGHDPLIDEDIQMRAHNLAAFRAQGSAATMDQPYPGLPTKDLCARVAQRDLRVNAAGLRRFKVILDRRGFRIHPGAAFRIQAPERGIGDIVLRAGEIDDGKMIDGRISIGCVQDVFGLPATSFVTPVENSWVAPSNEALPAEFERLDEATYRQAYFALGEADAVLVDEGDGYVFTVAGLPSVKSYSYNLLSRASGETDYQSTGEHYFTGTATTVAGITALETSFVVEGIVDFPLGDFAGQALLVGDEYMKIVTYDEVTFTFTVVRGALDVWPRAHPLGTRVWLVDDDAATDGRAYVDGDTVEALILPRTSAQALSEDGATLLTVDIGGRVARPYPPADVKVNGDSIYGYTVGEFDEPAFTWVERNRVTQADVLIGFFEATVAAEVGTTYRARFYDAEVAGTLLNTYDAITSGWVYDNVMQTADGADALTNVYVELVSVRDGIESWKPDRIRVPLRSGYGYGYGYNYGGLGA